MEKKLLDMMGIAREDIIDSLMADQSLEKRFDLLKKKALRAEALNIPVRCLFDAITLWLVSMIHPPLPAYP